MEDYIESIYLLVQQKGYARVSDISDVLRIQRPAVSKMIQRLDQEKYLIYEKYRGIVLTKKGEKFGKRLLHRHKLLERFLETIGVHSENIYSDVEGIEHHLSWDAIDRIDDLIQFFEEKEDRIKELRDIQGKKNEHDHDGEISF
ncbi:transcriptional regulator MntR [Tuberibacillus sp. Marseille-P3662]|uniref:transcriptional regulator MntR n=1 Tax=Tuberibacillus sp. Marseille-P3662 TaxID=1965358 RepID=UPI000A1C98D1|nr:transcriptional regulator MntR [Tuberibacillus sp. Marseille-P3662]